MFIKMADFSEIGAVPSAQLKLHSFASPGF